MRLSASLLVAIFLLASATLPFGHHGIECHLKSRTHCTACVVGTGARPTQNSAALVTLGLQDAGPVLAGAAATPDSLSLGGPSDRAPPFLG